MLDALDVSFAPNLQASSEIVKARELMPMNNIVKAVFTSDLDPDLVMEIDANYEYDADGISIRKKQGDDVDSM